MSDREKGKEKNEGEILDHFYHEHPLSLTVTGIRSRRCHGCLRFIYSNETAYTCHDECGSKLILHEECAEMPRELTLSMHHQHTLIQQKIQNTSPCSLCKKKIYIGYCCKSSDHCTFQIHVGCAQDIEVLKNSIDHPSHPHQLKLLWRTRRSCSFQCDACGTIQKGSSYMCFDCQYWIHESCAALSPTKDFPHHHHHHLSLAFHVPPEYVRFGLNCHICLKALFPRRYWVYHCQICRYVVHIKCAITNVSTLISNINAEDEDVIVFPADNAVEDMIRSFVTKVGEQVHADGSNGNYKFHNHDHQLRLISSTPDDEAKEKESVNDDDDDDDDDEYVLYGSKTKVICDGCTTPISRNQYMSCGECKSFLHLPCSQLPRRLLSHPLHVENHILTLQTTSKLDFTFCYVCRLNTNGLFYKCITCSWFTVDIKCASLPDTIKHAAHPYMYHHLKLLYEKDNNFVIAFCSACDKLIFHDVCYKCNTCEIIMHVSCCLVPESVTNRTWDKHPLPLRSDASMDHPSSFYCEVCETEMNPKSWMYHCHDCDVSIHPRCLEIESGEYRNIKFGKRYVVDGVHSHPLSFQLLTSKLRCDVCKERKRYGCFGFQCCSDKCDFFMCFYNCGMKRRDVMQAVD